jgi:DNA polymerase-3 subunit delta'
LWESVDRGSLPASLLLHGPRGVGKQRLALWLAQFLICTGTGARPCGSCQHCRLAEQFAHPDIHWYFPRPRLKDADASAESILEDYAEAAAERRDRFGLYRAPGGDEGIYVATVRVLVRSAGISPALARHKVYVVGDAERMVQQEGADYAANAFLKLLEEPPADTTLILTSSEPGALLPTIRSRVASVRVAPLTNAEVRSFVADPLVIEALEEEELEDDVEARVRLAQGAPGRLFGGGARVDAMRQARRLLEAAVSRRAADLPRAVFALGKMKARGSYTDTLDAVTMLLHRRVRDSVADDPESAFAATRAIEPVERSKALSHGNVNPALITSSLLRELREILG